MLARCPRSFGDREISNPIARRHEAEQGGETLYGYDRDFKTQAHKINLLLELPERCSLFLPSNPQTEADRKTDSEEVEKEAMIHKEVLK